MAGTDHVEGFFFDNVGLLALALKLYIGASILKTCTGSGSAEVQAHVGP